MDMHRTGLEMSPLQVLSAGNILDQQIVDNLVSDMHVWCYHCAYIGACASHGCNHILPCHVMHVLTLSGAGLLEH